MPTQFQRSVVGGEVAAALIPRMDQAKRSSGFELGDNWYLARTGVAYNRPGWEYVAIVKDSDDDFALKPFDFDDDDAYCLEFGDYYVRFHVDGTPLVTASVSAWVSQGYAIGDLVTKGLKTWYCCATHTTARDPETAAYQNVFWYELSGDATSSIFEIPSPYPEGVVPNVEPNQSSDVMTLTHSSYPPHELVRTGHTAWTLRPKRYAPSVPSPTGFTNIFNDGGTAIGNYGSPNSEYHPVYLVTAVTEDGESLPAVMTAGAGATGTIDDQGASADLVVASASHGMEAGILCKITDVACTDATNESNDAAELALDERVFVIKAHPTDPTNKFILEGTQGLLSHPGWYVGTWPPLTITYGRCELVPTHNGTLTGNKIQMPTATSNDQARLAWTAPTSGKVKKYLIYRKRTFKKGNVGPESAGDYGRIGETDKLTFDDDGTKTPDTERPPPLHPPPFVAGTNPAISTYHQQREAYARSIDGPSTVTMSATADFLNFTERFPVTADDRIQFAVAGQKVNEVRHIVSWGSFLLFTRGGVYAVNGDADGVLTPDAINSRLQDATGAGTVRPLVLGDTMIYVTRQQTRVKDLRYTLDSDTYRGDDLTAYAPHLFRGHTLVEWAYAENPDSIVYAVRDDGVLLMLTYVREHNIWSWTRATPPGGGLVKRVCVIPEGSEDRLYLGVQYTINGATVKYVCRQALRTAGDANHEPFGGQKFLDAFKTYDGTNLLSDGVTIDETTVLALTGGTTWLNGETLLTLTATVGTAPFPGDASNVGNGYRLLLADGTYVECEVTVDASTTVQTVKLLTDCPAGLQGVGVTAWCRMVDQIGSLGHLEGESVGVHGDGHDLGDFTVTSSALDATLKDWTDGVTARPYGIVHVGLRITAPLKLLPLDIINANDDLADLTKTVKAATLWLVAARGLQAGLTEAGLRHPDWLVPDDGFDDLVTGQRDVTFDSDNTRDGGILIRQTACLAAGVAAVMTHYDLGGR